MMQVLGRITTATFLAALFGLPLLSEVHPRAFSQGMPWNGPPSLQYLLTCYPPKQVRKAQHLLRRPSINPSKLVKEYAGLSLSQVSTGKRILPKPGHRVILLGFDYGAIPNQVVPTPTPASSSAAWLMVTEWTHYTKGQTTPIVSQGQGPEPFWQLYEVLPRHKLGVGIMTNLGETTVRQIGEALLRRDKYT